MWNGPIHDTDFVTKVLAHVDANEGKYGTETRMRGMLTVAKEVSFFFSWRVSSVECRVEFCGLID
jgi:tRNA (guanine26-N2/guanine27-N2)-dimethyltransferase